MLSNTLKATQFSISRKEIKSYSNAHHFTVFAAQSLFGNRSTNPVSSQHTLPKPFQNHLKTASTPFGMEIKTWRRATKIAHSEKGNDTWLLKVCRPMLWWICARLALQFVFLFIMNGFSIWGDENCMERERGGKRKFRKRHVMAGYRLACQHLLYFT
jgi:hypothetical protein